VEYPVAKSALAKWARERLDKLEERDEGSHFRFRYTGSTCTDGGARFEAHLHAVIDRSSFRVREAWIDFPDKTIEEARLMCAARGMSGPSLDSASAEHSSPFFERLAAPAPFSGADLEEEILKDVGVNYAGCFCAEPMVADKWNMALSTIHYVLTSGSASE
jgi:hypothetical protein